MQVFFNKKSGDPYAVHGRVINATNDKDGEVNILYQSVETGELFVREAGEFNTKFSPEDGSASVVIERQQVRFSPLLTVVQGLVAHLDQVLEAMEVVFTEDEGLPASVVKFLDDKRSSILEIGVAGFFRGFIVKLQRPPSSNVENPPFLLYNEDRSLCEEVSVTDDLLSWFGDDLKIYCFVRLWVDGTLQFVQRVEDKPW